MPKKSLDQLHESVTVTNKKGWRKFLAFIGPAYLVSVGYMDPGNWATDLQGGAKFGYQLIWVLLLSNLMAVLLQSLSARLGIVRRLDLAQVNRETYPASVNFVLYILAELAIAATDLAEVLGMAIGIKLLTGLPLLAGTGITVLDTFLFLLLQRYGIRRMEAFIILLVATIGISFFVQLFIASPDLSKAVAGLVPTTLDNSSLYIAVGIIGATVMPHNLYLHSALVQTRKIERTEKGIRRSIFFNFIDSAVALNAAFFVNAAILILAATTFFATGHQEVAKIEQAHALLAPLLGSTLAPTLFAIALIAAGQSSTVTGTLAGQIVMEGYLQLRLNPWVRRLLTRLIAITPAVLVIYYMGEKSVDDLLVFSQVILSMQLGFAVIPLIHFVSDKEKMGIYAIHWMIKLLAWLVAVILVYLNTRLLLEQLLGFVNAHPGHLSLVVGIIIFLLYSGLIIYIVIFPWLPQHFKKVATDFHGEEIALDFAPEQPIESVAIAVDFSITDAKLIRVALQQVIKENAMIHIIHIVESATAKYHHDASDDEESRKDQLRLDLYAAAIRKNGYQVTTHLAYQKRVKEIVRIVETEHAQLLVMGSHRHKGIKDFLFGETIESVRHAVSIPVLVVNR